MEAGIKAGTGSREFRLSCPASSSHIDVVYPQHVARGIEEEEKLAPRRSSSSAGIVSTLQTSCPSRFQRDEHPLSHRCRNLNDGPPTISRVRIRRKLILNGISWTMAWWIKIWKFRRVDKLRYL